MVRTVRRWDNLPGCHYHRVHWFHLRKCLTTFYHHIESQLGFDLVVTGGTVCALGCVMIQLLLLTSAIAYRVTAVGILVHTCCVTITA